MVIALKISVAPSRAFPLRDLGHEKKNCQKVYILYWPHWYMYPQFKLIGKFTQQTFQHKLNLNTIRLLNI